MEKTQVLNVRGMVPAVKWESVFFHGVEPVQGSEFRVGLRLEREMQFQGMRLFVLLEHVRGVVELEIELDTCVNREDIPDGYAVVLDNLFGDDLESTLMRTVAVVLCGAGRVSFSLPPVGDTLSVRFSMEAFEASASVPLETVGEYLMREAAL